MSDVPQELIDTFGERAALIFKAICNRYPITPETKIKVVSGTAVETVFSSDANPHGFEYRSTGFIALTDAQTGKTIGGFGYIQEVDTLYITDGESNKDDGLQSRWEQLEDQWRRDEAANNE